MKFIVLLKVTLVMTFVVIMLGAYTRLADAGLGCPDWPGCYGHLTVPTSAEALDKANVLYPDLSVEADKAWLEMIHRYFAGALGLLVFAISFIGIKTKRVPLTLSVAATAIVVFQALLGMWTVTLKLWPVVVMGHLLGGFALFSCLAMIYWQAQLEREPVDHLQISQSLRPWAALTLVVVVLQIALGGWTSSNYAALMCTSLPICEGDWMSHLDLVNAFKLIHPGFDNYEFGILDYGPRMTIHVAHRIGAIVTALVVAVFVFRCLSGSERALNRTGWIMFLLLIVQIALGVSNVLFSLPIGIAVAHNLGAALLLLAVLHANVLLWQPNEYIELTKETLHE